VARRPFAERTDVLAFECLGACPRRGRASISAPGRWSVAFGGLDDRSDAEPLCDLIAAWLERPHGEVPKAERPRSLRHKVIGRVPPPGLVRHSAPDAATPTNQEIRRVPLAPAEPPPAPRGHDGHEA